MSTLEEEKKEIRDLKISNFKKQIKLMRLKTQIFIRKYRAAIAFSLFVIFNYVESRYFGSNTKLGYNLKPMSNAEFICDMISEIGMVFSLAWIGYDIATFHTKIELKLMDAYLCAKEELFKAYGKDKKEEPETQGK